TSGLRRPAAASLVVSLEAHQPAVVERVLEAVDDRPRLAFEPEAVRVEGAGVARDRGVVEHEVDAVARQLPLASLAGVGAALERGDRESPPGQLRAFVRVAGQSRYVHEVFFAARAPELDDRARHRRVQRALVEIDVSAAAGAAASNVATERLAHVLAGF